MKFDRIKHLRLKMGMNRETLAKEIGVSLSALATYERGEREPSATLIVSLAEYFHVTSDYILGLSDIPKAAEGWPPTVTDEDITGDLHAIKEAVENMLASVKNNPYGIKTFDYYTTIINLLPDIDKFAADRLAELQIDYPAYRTFGTETELRFDGKPLLQALVDGSEEAAKFAKRLTATTARIHDQIIEIQSLIGNILNNWVFDAIKGQPLEKQPLYVDQLKKIKQALGKQNQAPGTNDEIGGEKDGNGSEAGK